MTASTRSREGKWLADVERARDLAELVVLSARAHGSGDVRTLKVLVEALDATAGRNRAFYHDSVLSGLNEAARRELEGLMSVKTYEWQSDFARKYVGIGREEGREAVARSVIGVLEARGFTVSDQVRSRIRSCTDLGVLEAWVPKAVTVQAPEDLFDRPSPRHTPAGRR